MCEFLTKNHLAFQKDITKEIQIVHDHWSHRHMFLNLCCYNVGRLSVCLSVCLSVNALKHRFPVGVSDGWQVTHDTWYVILDMWHMIHDIYL